MYFIAKSVNALVIGFCLGSAIGYYINGEYSTSLIMLGLMVLNLVVRGLTA